jgi:hypothetical protein
MKFECMILMLFVINFQSHIEIFSVIIGRRFHGFLVFNYRVCKYRFYFLKKKVLRAMIKLFTLITVIYPDSTVEEDLAWLIHSVIC